MWKRFGCLNTTKTTLCIVSWICWKISFCPWNTWWFFSSFKYLAWFIRAIYFLQGWTLTIVLFIRQYSITITFRDQPYKVAFIEAFKKLVKIYFVHWDDSLKAILKYCRELKHFGTIVLVSSLHFIFGLLTKQWITNT